MQTPPRRPKIRLCQLPIPQAAALAPTGNVPLAAGCLTVAARVHGLAAKVDIEMVPPEMTDREGDTRLADALAGGEPDVLGLSLYLWNVERSLHLAREVKRRSPRTRVVVGGPEVSADNPFVLGQQGFDIAVAGEAEDTFAALCAALLAGDDPAGLAGVAVRTPLGLSPFGPTPQANFPLTAYPSPYLAGVLPVDPERSTYVETVRGCRSHCTFCFYPRSSNVLRSLSVGESGALVERLAAAGAREVTFLDPTFNHRPELEPLLGALAEANPARRLSLFAEVRAEGLTAGHARAMARAGFTKLEIGLQSVNRATLQRTRRGGSPAKVAEAARLLRAEGIRLLVDLIVGLPGDSALDVARGVDFLLEHGLGAEAQVFPLALLPGTALRAGARCEGLVHDACPPYFVRRTATLDEEAIARALEDAEERLGRRLCEWPRPHLVDGDGRTDPPDVLTLDADDGTAEAIVRASRPAGRHLALWLRGTDLFARRYTLARAVEARLAVDPYCTLDVVLAPREPFPLDLVDFLRGVLGRGVPSYASRLLERQGIDAQRRLCVVLPRGVPFGTDWADHLARELPVYRDTTFAEAVRHELWEGPLGLRILDPVRDQAAWRTLLRAADPDAVSFAARPLEAAWTREAVGYREILE